MQLMICINWQPMFRREALMIEFLSSFHHPAVKVSVGDYITGGRQRWIDGIVVGSDTVRQDMHKGYTVEEQVTGQAKTGGLQFDIYPRRKPLNGNFFASDDLHYTYESGYKLEIGTSTSAPLSITATPAELNLQGARSPM